MTRRPTAPSQVARDARIPPALEDLAMRMLEKDPGARTVTIAQIRSHVQDWIEGIGDVCRPETLAVKLLWEIGGIALFVFLVWYLTGRSVAGMLYPHYVLNALGWFFVIACVGYPLWAFARVFRVSQQRPDRFRHPGSEQVFASGFYAFRRFASAVAPVFQLALFADVRSKNALEATTWPLRLAQLAVPAVCGIIYIAWVSGGRRSDAIEELVRPATSQDVLTAIPFLLLVPGVLARDWLYARWLRWRHPRLVADREGLRIESLAP